MYEMFCAVVSIIFVVAVPLYFIMPFVPGLGGNRKSVLSGDLNDPNHRP